MRRVFFSFKYEDVMRANVVRNSWAFAGTPERQAFGFVDAAKREQLKQQGDAAIAEWIREQMHGTSVTAVLMGAQTCESRWVRFEIEESVREGKGLLGIRIHEIPDPAKRPEVGIVAKITALFASEPPPPNMFDCFLVTGTNNAFWTWNKIPKSIEWHGREQEEGSDNLSRLCGTYDWKGERGRENIAEWIESAAKKAGR